MAANRDFTLKRHNGVDYDFLLPTTHVGQIFTDSTLATTLQSVLDAKINTNTKGAANGVAPLDSNGKILFSDLPDGVVGGMKFQAALAVSQDLDLLGDALVVATGEGNDGSYWIATSNITLTSGSVKSTMLAPGDEGDSDFPIAIETGDWVVLSTYVSGTYIWAIINNKYSNATTAEVGLVKLSDATDTSAMNGNVDVVTENVLFDVIGTGANKIAAGNHAHSGVYQPIDSDLTAIAGLAKADGNIIVGNGSAWIVEAGATARTSLGLSIGVNVQAYDAMLASLAGLSTAAATPTNSLMIYSDGTDTLKTTALHTFSRALFNNADAANWRTGLGLAIGTNVQAYDVDLANLVSMAKTNGNFVVGNGTTFVSETPATARTSMGVYSTTDVDNLLTNRPEFFYDTTTGAGTGDYIIDLD